MHQWTDAEKQALAELDHDLGSAELSAVLSEWVAVQVHRAFATTQVLGCWRTQLIQHGWNPQVADAALPLILDRIWPSHSVETNMLPIGEFMDRVTDQITDYILSEEDDEDEDDEDDN